MTLGTTSNATYARFERICRLVAARGDGLTLLELRDAADLARELKKENPAKEEVDRLAESLGVEAEALLNGGEYPISRSTA